ncbi:uncharacterized protein PV09_05657 [Verruconis gallopava]|uniref:alpha-1,2-Mannosidase n=1 Tax=Verruconis gallopava TaxID=253628 RepID=A0A0D2AV57_9PEZI|nr:uncharacterized protein PV09_05657 [Verruconis gallopava]KIW02999.1 hypothetical protein PV09_05657 [Verruconis gallopava]
MRFKFCILLATCCLASPLLDRESRKVKREVQFSPNQERADAVKEAFLHAWDGYYRYAFPNDELRPVSNGYSNGRNGWGASAVDALSTAIIMELVNIVDEIVKYVPTINWSSTSSTVSVFETTIRYLGGLLSSYDLLNGPFSHLIENEDLVNGLLQQAKDLADHLAPAFNTATGIPDNMINITTGELTTVDQSTGLAVAGTLVMEWTRLSDLLNEPHYATLAQTAENFLLRPTYQDPNHEPFPGLEGTTINFTTGQFLDVYGGWGGGTDSFYEYLIKMWVYDRNKYGEYKDRWTTAADSTIQFLLQHPSSRPDITFVASYDGQSLVSSSGHLAGFIGGNFLLGGLVLERQDYIDAGLQFTAAWHETYVEDATGIGPENFSWLPESCASNQTVQRRQVTNSQQLHDKDFEDSSGLVRGQDSTVPSTSPIAVLSATSNSTPSPASCSLPASATAQAQFYAKSGFYITTDSYDLRPEVLESYYYAYRITGDTKYQDWAWDAFVAINSTARVGSGFSSFKGVNGAQIQYGDFQESFLFAEVLKYAYLIFAEDGPWQVNFGGNGTNAYVFNTEAHPIRVNT